MHDLHFAFRQLLKHPGLTLIAVTALALGIGANTAIFSVLYGVVLRPLPFPEQDRLVVLNEWSEQVPNMSVSYPNFIDFRAQQSSFSALGAARNQSFNYAAREGHELVAGVMSSHDVFTALGTPPLLGRVFGPSEDAIAAERTVVLSEKFWRSRLGARGDVLGEKVTLNDHVYTVIGVMPAAFQYPNANAEAWVPLGLFANNYPERGNHPGITCIGRLKPGVSFDQAVTDMKAIAGRLAEQYPDTNARQSVALQSLNERAFGRFLPALLVVFGAALCVLLIACANVANLQLARAHARSREFSVRAALGAGRARIAKQLLIESTLLGLLGCGAGLVLGYAALYGIKTILPSNLPRASEISLNGWVLGFTIAVSFLTSLLFGLVPAVHAAKTDLREALNQGTRGSTGAGQSWRGALIVTEFAVTCILLVCAGLMIRTMANLRQADTGYTTQGLLTFQWMHPTLPPGANTAPRLARIEAGLERLRTLPGVIAVSAVTTLPLGGSNNQSSYLLQDKPEPERGRKPNAEVAIVTPEYFATMGIQILQGRGITADDRKDARKVALVDTEFVAKNFAPGESPLGKRFVFGGRPEKAEDWIEIVGVVEHIQNYGLGQPTREQTYQPLAQRPPSYFSVVLRTGPAPGTMVDSVRRTMREIAPDLPIVNLRTMDELFDQSIGAQRITVILLAAFAGLGLSLAGVGLYGVISYSVTLRTREIGVRMALGAEPGNVLRHVLRQGLKLAVFGLLLGLVGGVFATKLLQSVLYEVSRFDLLSFATVAVVLASVGVCACWIPARRATRINPTEALRAD